MYFCSVFKKKVSLSKINVTQVFNPNTSYYTNTNTTHTDTKYIVLTFAVLLTSSLSVSSIQNITGTSYVEMMDIKWGR